MGDFHPEDPQSSLVLVTTSPCLAFKGMTLAELKAKLDDGYELFAQMFGKNINAQGKMLASFYNAKPYPSAGAIQKIFGDFCIANNETKAVCVEFTDGVDGVYVKALQTLYANTGTAVTTDFMNVAADGTVMYKNYKTYPLLPRDGRTGRMAPAIYSLPNSFRQPRRCSCFPV